MHMMIETPYEFMVLITKETSDGSVDYLQPRCLADAYAFRTHGTFKLTKSCFFSNSDIKPTLMHEKKTCDLRR